MKCPGCGSEVPDGRVLCPNCGMGLGRGGAGQSASAPSPSSVVSEASEEAGQRTETGTGPTVANEKGVAVAALVLSFVPLLPQVSIPYLDSELNVVTLFSTFSSLGSLTASVGASAGAPLVLLSFFYLIIWIVAVVLAVRVLAQASKGTESKPMTALVVDAIVFLIPVVLQMLLSSVPGSFLTGSLLDATPFAWIGLIASIALAVYAHLLKGQSKQ